MKRKEKTIRPRLRGGIKKAYERLTSVENRVLTIGDLHEPFTLEGYLSFCKKVYAEYNCNAVVFIGDVIDNHYSSYHETDANGMGGKDELDFAISKIAKWYKAFPNAYITIGNHDRIIMRKAQTSNIPSKWIKNYNEVLGTPNWRWVEDVYIDDVRYVHGDKSSQARTAAKRDMISTVSGHFHTQCYVEWFFGKTRAIFAMQVGAGIDSKSYAMGYMQGGKKEAVAVGVVVGGHTAFNVKMNLTKP
jgi:metallophosphoesterase superfamily enzyme